MKGRATVGEGEMGRSEERKGKKEEKERDIDRGEWREEKEMN